MSEEKKEVLLELRGIKTFFPVRSGFFNKVTDYVQAVNNVDLDIYRGETLGLVGESGCGKTTLGKSIIQLVHATNGTMMYDFGEEGGKKDLRKLSKQDVYKRQDNTQSTALRSTVDIHPLQVDSVQLPHNTAQNANILQQPYIVHILWIAVQTGNDMSCHRSTLVTANILSPTALTRAVHRQQRKMCIRDR